MKKRNHSLKPRLENRELMAADIIWIAVAGRFYVNGDTELNDVAHISITKGNNVHIQLEHRNGLGLFVHDETAKMPRSQVKEIRFDGKGGDDRFTNDTSVRSFAHGGFGNDTLIGGTGRDVLWGDFDNDELHGRGNHDILRASAGWIVVTKKQGAHSCAPCRVFSIRSPD